MDDLNASHQARAPGATWPRRGAITPTHVLGKLTDKSTQPAIVVAEVMALPLIAVGLGWLAAPLNPFEVQAAFPWVWLAPLVVALRYGPLAGIASSSVLVVAWLALNVGHLDSFPNAYFLGGLIVVTLAGEFSSAWQVRMHRAETLQIYLDQRFQQLLHQHYLLRLSHDRLARELIGRPMSVHDVLLGLRDVEVNRADGTRGTEALLRVLVQYCQLDCAAIHAVVEGRVSTEPAAAMGAYPEFDAGDALVQQALQTGKLCHISDAVAARQDSRYLVAAPLRDLAGSVYALLVVQEMPFFALQLENLQALQLVLASYTDSLSMNLLARPIIDRYPGCPLEFAFELERLAHVHRLIRRSSTVLALEVGSEALAQRVSEKVGEIKDPLDQVWWIKGATRQVLAVLVALEPAATAHAYLKQLEDGMQAVHRQSLAQAGIVAHVLELGNAKPLDTVKRIHDLIAH